MALDAGAVLRPSSSPFMPLCRVPRRPDPVAPNCAVYFGTFLQFYEYLYWTYNDQLFGDAFMLEWIDAWNMLIETNFTLLSARNRRSLAYA